mmetsp:Transcript_16571/g.49593  ORF Transcript_16571/g.49593 Transcript_16571/m.49593 type:complete len:713 (+) Transcript_16571:175-2313(+)
MNEQQQAVAAEPRLFVGQCGDATADQLAALFGPFAARGLRALHLLRKGCAMVLFERWAEAEAAQEAHNGRTRLNGGRPLVVTFANPKRIRQGEPPEPAIAPRKLFIGQVPKDASEGDLRPLFEMFGEIVCLNVLRTQRGQGPSAGCAFVEYRKWAQAERAMEAHNGITKLPGSDMPLVVKFADAKRPEMGGGGFMGAGGPMGGPRGSGWSPHAGQGAFGSGIMGPGYGGHVNGGGGMHGGMYGSPYGVPASGPMGLGVGVRLPDGRLIPNTPGSFGPGSTLRSNGLGLPPSGLSPGGLGALGGGGLHPGGMEGAEGLNALGGLGPKQLAAMEAVAAGVPMSAAQLSAAGLPEQLAALTAAIPAAGLPLSASDTGSRGGLAGVAGASSAQSLAATPALLSPRAPDASDAAAGLLSGLGASLGALSLSDQASIAGAAAGLQAAGLGAGGLSGAGSLADASAQLAALSADASAALEAALAGRASTLSADSAAGLMAAQQVLQQQAEQQAVATSAALCQLSALEALGAEGAASAAGVSTTFGSLPASEGAVAAAANAAAANALSSAAGTALVDSLAAAGNSGYQLGSLPMLSNPLGPDLPMLTGADGLAGGLAPGGPQQWPPRRLDHAAQNFKLFVGQVPMEATEQDLWALFSPIGDVLELYVLRNNQTGRSRGCAFVTYASRQLAEQAITQLNGRQVGRGAQRQLVVKFADRVPA